MTRTRLPLIGLISLVLLPIGESHAAPPFKEHTFGFAGTVPVSADYDGDGKDDLAVYDAPAGEWYIFRSALGFIQEQFGFSGTIPVVGDYDGDGKDDKALFAPASSTWYLFRSSLGFLSTVYGYSGVVPVPGDYDGDGKTDLAVYNAPNGQWSIFRSQLGPWNPQFGFAGTVPVAADYDGDGKTDIAVYHPPSGMWYISRSSLGFIQQQFGYAGPLPAPADFDGDGKADYGLFNTNNNSRIFHTWQSTRGHYTITFPATGLPRPSDFEGDGQKKLVVYNSTQAKWFADLTFVDWDLDGLPTSWENAHGLNDQDNGSTNLDNGPEGDPDGDGYLNMYEYRGGSNPKSKSSVPLPTIMLTPGGNTIQQAIDSTTQPYAIIRLGAGTYTGQGNKNISFRGKKIMVTSQDGPAETILDAQHDGRGFVFTNGESRQSVVSGLTIMNGYAERGGGILCITSSPTIFNCVIKKCEATAYGGGIILEGSSLQLTGCEFRENRAGSSGGAVFSTIHLTANPYVMYRSSPVIEGSLMYGNSASNGAAIYNADAALSWPYTGSAYGTLTIVRCRISGNTGSGSSAVVILSGGKAVLNNCLINGNRGRGVFRDSQPNGSGVAINHCTIINNLGGSSAVRGVGVYSLAGSDAVTMRNTIVWGNDPESAQVYGQQINSLVTDYCNVDQTPDPYSPNYAIFNNTMWVAPQLSSSGRVKAGSPMRNAGSAAFSISPDIDGENRDSQPDLGFDEYVDADGDTLPDYWENMYGLSTSLYHDPLSDNDGDDLTNAQEADLETNPLASDTDGDGLNDADEIAANTNPLVADSDGDGIYDGDEIDGGTNPNSSDTDGDGILDGVDPDPTQNDLAEDLILYVDSEGGAPQQSIPKANNVFIPQGTKAVYYKVTVFSREFPTYTSTQSQYDVVTWKMTVPSPLQGQALISYNVNTLHNQFTPGELPGGNVVVKEGFLDYSAVTAVGASWLNFEATAKNVSDNKLGSGVGIQVSILKVDLDAMKVSHNAANGELPDTYETSPGAFVPINNDDDDYDASNTADKDQSGSITGESDLLPIKLHKVDPAVTGSKYTLDIPTQVKIWQNSDRSGAVTGTAEFDANVDTTLYVEGVTVGSGNIKINWKDGTTTLDDCDEIKVTVYNWSGPLNVPGYAIYEYKANGALGTSQWITPSSGTIKTGANSSDVTILWNGGPVVGKAIYQVNANYIWDLEVNVVQIKISSANNSAAYPGGSRQSAVGSRIFVTSPVGGGQAMTANFRVELIKGPTVNGSDRGVKFMEMGQVHQARWPTERAFYDNSSPAQKRVGLMENYQSGTWLWDPASAATIPWTFQNAQHYLKPTTDAQIQNRDFSTFDAPMLLITDQIVFNGDTVDRSAQRMDHAVYFAVKTTIPDINGSSDVLTQRLILEWHVLADGTWNQSTGVWTFAGSGDGVDGDNAWTEVTSGDQVPAPTVNDAVNTLINTPQHLNNWTPSNQ